MNAYGITVDQIVVEPGTERWYSYSAESYVDSALEMVYEWDYAEDAHGYCHVRSILVGLLREIERLRPKLGVTVNP